MKTRRASGRAAKEIMAPEIPHIILETPNATPARIYTDMPTVNFFATPQQPAAPPIISQQSPTPAIESLSARMQEDPSALVAVPDNPPPTEAPHEDPSVPAAPSHEPTPIPLPTALPKITPVQQQVSKKQSLSTPRRKSYIRNLEFETPTKPDTHKKPATSPKIRMPSARKTPNLACRRNLRNSPASARKLLETIPVSGLSPPEPMKTSIPIDTSVSYEKPVEKVPPSLEINVELNRVSAPADLPPIATKTPGKPKLSNAWDEMGGVSCVLGQSSLATIEENDQSKSFEEPISNCMAAGTKKTPWDANLRFNVSASEQDLSAKSPRVKKEIVKKRKRTKKPKSPGNRRVTRSKTIVSPSKISQTAKRSTYAISHGSSSAFESSSNEEDVETMVQIEMTPAKEDELKMPAEETPFTKLLRENVTNVDIDLSMIQTPFFPQTPGVNEPITPFHNTRPTDYSSGSSYYKPDLTSPGMPVTLETVRELQRSEECLQDVSTISGRVLLVTPEKTDASVENNTIIASSCGAREETDHTIQNGTGTPSSCDNSDVSSNVSPEKSIETPNTSTEDRSKEKNNVVQKLKNTEEKINELVNEGKKIVQSRRSSGKILSLLKMQMIAQCNVKLSENIPLSDSPVLSPSPIIGKQSTFQDELKRKRINTIDKIKDMLPTGEKRMKKPLQRPLKKLKVSATRPLVSSTPNKSSLNTGGLCEMSPPPTPSINMDTSHVILPQKLNETLSSPTIQQSPPKTPDIKNNSSGIEKLNEDIKKEIPSFSDDGEFPYLSLATKKKLHTMKSIINRNEVKEFLTNSKAKDLKLKPCIKKLIRTMYKWMLRDDQHDFKNDPQVVEKVIYYLGEFKKICELTKRKKKKKTSNLENMFEEFKKSEDYCSEDGSSIDSQVGAMWKDAKGNSAHALPPKKRKNTKEKVCMQSFSLF